MTWTPEYRSVYNKEYYLRKKEHIKEYYLKNKDHIKEYYLKNKERIREVKKQYYLKNREHLTTHMKEYHLKNKEHTREYYKGYYLKNKILILQKHKIYREKLFNKNINKELQNRAHKVHGVDGIPIQADSVCGSPLFNTAESASIKGIK
jgi:hypothetical protein